MKTQKYLLLPFTQTLYFEGEIGGGGDVGAAPAPAPETVAADSSPAPEETSVESQASVIGTEDQAQQQAPADPVLEGLPTREELAEQAERKVPYAVGLKNVVEAYEALKLEHQPLKTTIEPWQGVLEKYQNPAEVQTGLELLESLSTPVLNNGIPVLDENQLPVTDASPFITRLATERPAQATALINAALKAELVENGVRDTALNWALKDLGIDPKDVEGYKAWKQQGAPVATEAIDLSQVPQKYHEVLRQLPVHIQQDRLAMPEEARDWQLERDLKDFERDQRDVVSQRQAQAEFETAISQATDKTVDEGFQKGFNQFLQQISSWQPTADANVNKAYHLELASSLVNLLDTRMEFANKQLLQAAGIPFDPEIQTLNESYQRNVALAERYKAHNSRNGNMHTVEFTQAENAAKTDYLRLVQKIEDVSGKLIEFKNKIAKAEAGAEEAANLGSRPTIQGAPAGGSNGQGVNPDWYKAYQRTA